MEDRLALSSASQPRREFAHEPDGRLFVFMTDQDVNPARAKAAQDELYHRHAAHVHGAARCVASPRHYDADDAMQETFEYVYSHPHKFDVHRARDQAACARAYLCGVARRLIRSNWPRDREGNFQLQSLPANEIGYDEGTRVETKQLTEEHQRVIAAYEKLDPREWEIVQQYLRWYDPELERQQVPVAYQNAICAKYGITRDNLRAIKSRVLRDLGSAATGKGDAR